MKTFQLWVGPGIGKTTSILDWTTRELAEQAARTLVLESKRADQSMVANVFNCREGRIVSSFATPDLKDQAKRFPIVQIL